jgi:hypothetical protein
MNGSKFRSLILLAFMTFGMAATGHAAVYYVDATSGNDASAGTQAAPWRSLTKVNSTPLPAGSTVYFKAGGAFGSTFLTPSSGSATSPVTYTSYGTGAKPTMGGLNATGKSYVKVSGLAFSSSSTVLNMTSASYVTVDNCSVNGTASGWSPAIQFQTNSRYNRITNCTITQSAGNNDCINFKGNADYNLIEGNNITISGVHAAIDLEGQSGGGTAHYNVIRKNVITGHNAAGSLITMQANSSYNIVEGNVLTGDSTTSGYCGTNSYARHQTMFKLVSVNNIVRNNIIKSYPCRDSLGLTMEAYNYGGFNNIASGNRIYNNVITGIGVGGTPLYLGDNGSGGSNFNNVLKNNIVYNNGGTYYQTNQDGSWPSDTANLQMRVQSSTKVYNNTFQNNLFYKNGISGLLWVNNAYYSVAQAQAWSPTLYKGNLQTDPLLDATTLRPTANSPVKGAGAHLTTVASASGSGTTLKVADASYFTAGLGLMTGDTIQVGTQRATIKAVDYATNTLTLAASISWTQGANVDLPYSGTAPDMGLLPASTSAPVATLSAPSGLTVN